MKFQINNTFTDVLPSDPIVENTRRQVRQACYSFVEPTKTKAPLLLHHSKEVAELLGISEEETQSEEFLNIFTGNALIPDSKPYAMCYGGHQFGHWAGQLGDGRAINLAEVEHKNKRWTLQLKGAGATPYSRTADGLAVLRSSIREYLCSEAMFHLGVPTTRALSLALSGDEVMRDMFYNGNAAYEKGAIVCRVAPSFLRFGSYEIFASRGETETLKKLVDYTIQEFYPQLTCDKEGYIQLLKEVSAKTLDMVIHWQRVGFVHGVMNTDNMSILGLTIDYGPYGWLEPFERGWTPNTTDAEHKRYQFGDQAQITLWNLVKLANALYPLIEDAAPLEEILNAYQEQYFDKYIEMMNAKLGLEKTLENDFALIQQLENVLELTETDMTIFFRHLSDISKNKNMEEDTSGEFLAPFKDAFYKPEELKGEILTAWKDWFGMYLNRLEKETLTDKERKEKMDAVNPKYVLRNYMAQLAIEAADKGDYSIINELAELLKKPYDTQKSAEKWFAKRPEWARVKPGCSMLSCSS
ncbi:protein adenylyltransferase SelO [Aureivirga sp. CE67]|uniref:protein adenylyltransferase SelO n=1 Tax=Aureivirga sp. CE67 TaxID=1788983 RepID=UPI0018CAA16F|nr:YdiU family protein [Aureivirga sp. CE67]